MQLLLKQADSDGGLGRFLGRAFALRFPNGGGCPFNFRRSSSRGEHGNVLNDCAAQLLLNLFYITLNAVLSALFKNLFYHRYRQTELHGP